MAISPDKCTWCGHKSSTLTQISGDIGIIYLCAICEGVGKHPNDPHAIIRALANIANKLLDELKELRVAIGHNCRAPGQARDSKGHHGRKSG